MQQHAPVAAAALQQVKQELAARETAEKVEAKQNSGLLAAEKAANPKRQMSARKTARAAGAPTLLVYLSID